MAIHLPYTAIVKDWPLCGEGSLLIPLVDVGIDTGLCCLEEDGGHNPH